MPKQEASPTRDSGGSGSVRARLRLVAVMLLGLLAATYLVFAVRLYFLPAGEVVSSGLVGVLLALVALVYVLITMAVVRQSRPGHIVAIVACVIALVLTITPGMTWIDWTMLAANAVAALVLLGCIPRKVAPKAG